MNSVLVHTLAPSHGRRAETEARSWHSKSALQAQGERTDSRSLSWGQKTKVSPDPPSRILKVHRGLDGAQMVLTIHISRGCVLRNDSSRMVSEQTSKDREGYRSSDDQSPARGSPRGHVLTMTKSQGFSVLCVSATVSSSPHPESHTHT